MRKHLTVACRATFVNYKIHGYFAGFTISFLFHESKENHANNIHFVGKAHMFDVYLMCLKCTLRYWY